MEKFVDKVPLRGTFGLRVYKSGKLIEEILEENLVVNVGRFQMAHLVAGEVVGRSIAKIAFGTSNAEPDVTDNAIAEQWAKPVAGHSYPENGKVQFDWELLTSENNGMAILEFGLLTADGHLFARRIRETPLNKAADISLEGHWTLIF